VKILRYRIAQYALHAFVATYGISILSFFVEGFLPQRRSTDFWFLGPTFLFPIAIGLALGALWGTKLPRLSSRLVFLLPLFLLIWETRSFFRYNNDISWRNFYESFLGAHCESSECLGPLIITAPLLSSMAYAIGAEIARALSSRVRRAPIESDSIGSQTL
jgi:hypothetical protein